MNSRNIHAVYIFLQKLITNTTILNQEIWVLHNVVRQKFLDVSEERTSFIFDHQNWDSALLRNVGEILSGSIT
jgi:hypothetical protein